MFGMQNTEKSPASNRRKTGCDSLAAKAGLILTDFIFMNSRTDKEGFG